MTVWCTIHATPAAYNNTSVSNQQQLKLYARNLQSLKIKSDIKLKCRPKPTRSVAELAAETQCSVVMAWNLCRVHDTNSGRDDGKSASCTVNLRWRSWFTREWFDT